MKSISLYILIILPIHLIGQGHLQVEGSYQGNDLYVQNPENESVNGFCIDSVFVNNIKRNCEVNASAFVIEFDTTEFFIGKEIIIDIYHGRECKPKILNTNHHQKPTFGIQDISIDSNAVISVSITGQGFNSVFVEQYRWNKWVKVSDDYFISPPLDTIFDVSQTIHSGSNKFRIVYVDYTGKKKPSKSVIYDSLLPKEDYTIDRENQKIIFNRDTRYEIYDANGNLLIKGIGLSIDISNLKQGAYYLNYGNENEKFKTKRLKK